MLEVDADTTPVTFTVVELTRTNVGRIRAYAAVEIEVSGVVFAIQGITVVRVKDMLSVEMPQWKLDGRPMPAFCLPEELNEPVGRAVARRA